MQGDLFAAAVDVTPVVPQVPLDEARAAHQLSFDGPPVPMFELDDTADGLSDGGDGTEVGAEAANAAFCQDHGGADHAEGQVADGRRLRSHDMPFEVNDPKSDRVTAKAENGLFVSTTVRTEFGRWPSDAYSGVNNALTYVSKTLTDKLPVADVAKEKRSGKDSPKIGETSQKVHFFVTDMCPVLPKGPRPQGYETDLPAEAIVTRSRDRGLLTARLTIADGMRVEISAIAGSGMCWNADAYEQVERQVVHEAYGLISTLPRGFDGRSHRSAYPTESVAGPIFESDGRWVIEGHWWPAGSDTVRDSPTVYLERRYPTHKNNGGRATNALYKAMRYLVGNENTDVVVSKVQPKVAGDKSTLKNRVEVVGPYSYSGDANKWTTEAYVLNASPDGRPLEDQAIAVVRQTGEGELTPEQIDAMRLKIAEAAWIAKGFKGERSAPIGLVVVPDGGLEVRDDAPPTVTVVGPIRDLVYSPGRWNFVGQSWDDESSVDQLAPIKVDRVCHGDLPPEDGRAITRAINNAFVASKFPADLYNQQFETVDDGEVRPLPRIEVSGPTRGPDPYVSALHVNLIVESGEGVVVPRAIQAHHYLHDGEVSADQVRRLQLELAARVWMSYGQDLAALPTLIDQSASIANHVASIADKSAVVEDPQGRLF